MYTSTLQGAYGNKYIFEVRERSNIIGRLFLAILDPLSPYDGILTFSVNPLPHMTF